ncbi:MAG: hypothetical protein K0U59_11285 [Gammaproteobacteria bacterium]|nr:hypothetical protein [Gammaproteobacteria bacterium]
MRDLLRKLSCCFAAGCFAGLVYALSFWALGHYGVFSWLSVDIVPSLSNAYLYQRVVWGGIYGLMFLLPWRGNWLTRGVFLALIPASILLLWLLPARGYGIGGTGLGLFTPLVVTLACGCGGLAGSCLLWLQGK